MRYAIHRHLALFHGLQECGLRFRRRAVYLVGQHDLRQDRPGSEFKLAGLLVKNGNAGDVAGEHVGRELDATELAADGARQRPREHRLAHAGYVFDQDVPLAQQTDYCQFNRISFSKDYILHVVDYLFPNAFYLFHHVSPFDSNVRIFPVAGFHYNMTTSYRTVLENG